MAKTVSDIFLRLKLEGQGQVAGLKSAFKSLTGTLDVTDKAIEDLRKGVKDYTNQSNNSIKVLKGQIDALKNLREQASIGGTVFKQLADDIKLYERQLKNVEQQANNTAAALSAKQIGTRLTKLGVPGLQAQLGDRRKLLNTQDELTTAYAETLGQVLQFEAALSRIEQRQAVIAAQARTVSFTAARGGTQELDIEGLVRYAGVFQELPNTTAGLSQRLRELRQDFANLDIGGEDYLRTIREIDRVQKDIARGERIRELTLQDQGLQGRQGTLEAFIEGRRGRRTRLTSRLGTEAEDYRARQAAARRAQAPVPTQVREISTLYGQITDIGMARTRGLIDAMGNSYQQVTRDIKAATAASNGSINSLQSQRAAWTTLRAGLRPSTKAFKEVTKEIEKVDRQLAKLERRKGLTGRNLVAGVGGALSGAVFGGPEAAIGGLIGGLGFGPGGAAVGAAAGAQLSALRQQAAAVAEFAGQLNLAKTTLAQASTGIRDYNRLLTLARQVSSDYSVSLMPAISGLAQIATAARANNLSFEDTEKIFRGLIASNVAFGKSQEDLDAIIRATVQVLSKGKVSAEELSGQIGERLPGAVAKFAAANEMTLPQLTKAFKDGEVTIAQFVRFAAAQGEEYDGVAQLIADGPEKAGIRLQIALEQAGENFGGFFLKVGSGFQGYLTNLVTFVNENQEKIKDVIVDVKIAADQIVEIVQTLIEEIKETVGPIFTFIAENLNRGVGAVYSKVREGRELRAGGFDFDTASKQAEKTVRGLGYDPIFTPNLFGQSFNEEMNVLRSYARQKGRGVLGEGVKSDAVSRQQIKESLFGFTPSSFGGAPAPTPGGGDLDASGAKSKDISRQQADLLTRIANLRRQGLSVQADILEFERALLKTKEMGETPEKARVARAQALEKFSRAQESWFKGYMRDVDQSLENRKEKEGDINAELKERQYQLGLISKEEYTQFQIAEERARLTKAYPGEGFAGKRAEAEDLYRREVDPTFKEGAQTEVKKMEEGLEKMTKPLEQLKGAAMAFGESISQAFSNIVTGSQTAQQAMASFLKNLGQYFVEYAAKVITQMIAIATIQAVIKALGGPSTGGGDAGASSTPDISGFSSYDISNTPTLASFGNAQGNAFNKGIKRYAMGGVVNKPTMFTYAEGGTGRFGLMGEAGPEAIIPLKRGNDGRLGVSAYFADANAAMAKGAANRSSSAEAFDENADALAMSSSYVRERSQERERQTMLTGAGGSMLIQTEVINNVEYATMDQVAQATAASAKQARAQVFADMRNKPATRSSLGMR